MIPPIGLDALPFPKKSTPSANPSLGLTLCGELQWWEVIIGKAADAADGPH